MVLLLVFMQLTRDLFAIAKFLLNYCNKGEFVQGHVFSLTVIIMHLCYIGNNCTIA